MVILKEITTEIYVDNESPVVVELGGSEKTSLQNAFDTFNQLGFDANDILKIESTEYPRHYTATELAQKGVDNYELMWQYIRESERAH